MKEDISDTSGAEYKERRLLCSSSSTSTSSAKKRRSSKMEDGGSGVARACTECGKKFWSWKALFGHMRCHPERQWRGINPPPNFRRQQQQHTTTIMTPEDHEVASCLLLLANSTSNIHHHQHHKTAKLKGVAMVDDCSVESPPSSFECSSCNKVFGSHQALGGHRASHKNVKGCFANTSTTIPATARLMTWTGQSQGGDYFHHDQALNEGGDGYGYGYGYGYGDQGEAVTVTADQGHKCSICLKVFTTGQALGGHKRCHWERGDINNLLIDSSSSQPQPPPPPPNSLVDLNFPLPLHDVLDHPPSSSPLTLDLKLGF